MITGVLVAGFILFMAFWWASQGAFTALLHLVAVICAGAIAFAVWEPLGVGLLLTRQYDYARGIALLSSFLLALLVFRACFDNLIKFTMKLNIIVNFGVGGLCGFFSGVLTSGIMVLGMSMMPLGPDLGGFRPYVIKQDGSIEKDADLFPMNVDVITADFYSRLSMGAFSSSSSLAEHHPELRKQAYLYRLTYDRNSALTMGPEAIKISRIYALDTPISEQALSKDMSIAIGGVSTGAGNTLYSVVTEWFTRQNAADSDGTVRIPPTQVRLQVRSTGENGEDKRTLLAPVGFTLINAATQERIYHPINNTTDFAYLSRDGEAVVWLFAAKASDIPEFVLFRQNRYRINQILKPTQNPTQMTNLLGRPVDGASVATSTPTGTDPANPAANSTLSPPKIYSKFPDGRFYSRPLSELIDVEPTAGPTIRSGRGILRPPTPGNKPDPEVIIREFSTPKQLVMVQMPFTRDGAYTYLKAAMNLAANLQTVMVVDNNGSQYQPVGYMIQQGENLIFKLDPQNKIRNIAEIDKLNDIKAGDTFYFLFQLPWGVRLVSFKAGNKTEPIDLQIPAQQ